jgi:hypothetical protein
VVKIFMPVFLLEDGEARTNVSREGDSAHPQRERISEEVNVSVVLDPEVDTPTEVGQFRGRRVACVAASQDSIGQSHDFLEFPSFAKKTWEVVVDIFGVGLKIGEWSVSMMDKYTR